jgi:beta-lactamase family protein
LGRRPSFLLSDNQRMEIVSFGETCLRLRGREGIVATDAYPRIVGPTGRGLTADIVTYSHEDGQQSLGLRQATDASGSVKRKSARSDGQRVPTSLEPAFLLDSPGEFEVHHVLVTGVQTYRDEHDGAERGTNVCFVYELDGVHVAHLGDVGHLLTQAQVAEFGGIDVLCVPIGGSLGAARAAELVAQLDANLIVPMPLDGADAAGGELERFLHEMSVAKGEAVAKLSVTSSSIPAETTVVLLDPRGR